MEKHKEYTPGKLLLDEQNDIVSADGWGVVAAQITYNLFKGNPIENKRRIVACWNACEGIETQMLELAGNGIWKKIEENDFERICEIGKLQSQNARLLEALKGLIQVIEFEAKGGDQFKTLWINQARAAIAETAQDG